jgi:hypothetical protein
VAGMAHGVGRASQSSGHDERVDLRHGWAAHCSNQVSRVRAELNPGRVRGASRVEAGR